MVLFTKAFEAFPWSTCLTLLCQTEKELLACYYARKKGLLKAQRTTDILKKLTDALTNCLRTSQT